MKRLPLISSDAVIKRLKKAGLKRALTRERGAISHSIRENPDGEKLRVIIPRRDPVPRGTLISVLKQARLTKEEFIELK